MSLPTTINLPYPTDTPDQNPKEYLTQLIYRLENMYKDLAQVSNGIFRNDAFTGSFEWKPKLNGSVSGDFTYTHQYGWVLRQGIITEIWGDILWTATAASGNMYLELPYLVTKSNGLPFVGVCQFSDITLSTGTYLTLNCNQASYKADFWESGSGVTMTQLAVPSSGRIIFHARYIGVSSE